MILLRVGRRRTAWEAGVIDEIIKTEFRAADGVDLHPSVYEVGEECLVQTVAEHSASNNGGARGFDNIDIQSDREFLTTPGEGRFEFTNAAHRELRFADEDDLRRFLLEVVLPQIETRKKAVKKAEIRDYVKARLAANDPEWVRHRADSGTWP